MADKLGNNRTGNNRRDNTRMNTARNRTPANQLRFRSTLPPVILAQPQTKAR